MSKIDKTKVGDSWYYDYIGIADMLKASFDQKLYVYVSQTGKGVEIIDERWAEGRQLVKFLDWFGKNCAEGLQTQVYYINKAIKKDYEITRTTSRKFRWEIAYKQQYKCNHCNDLLHPKSFDIDHIMPLFKGGQDNDLNNLQALCCNCHALKSRTEKQSLTLS